MRSMFHRDLAASGHRAATRPAGDPASMYLSLCDADGGLPAAYTPRRRLAALCIAFLVLLNVSLMWMAGGPSTPMAVAHGSSSGHGGGDDDGGDDDREGRGGGGDDDEGNTGDRTTGLNGRGDTAGTTRGDNTRNDTRGVPDNTPT
jgi:hypothetical protein